MVEAAYEKIDLDFVFGDESKGTTPRDRAKTSKVKFIFGEKEQVITTYRGVGTGRQISAEEAFERFGFLTLLAITEEIYDKGSAFVK